MALEPDPYYAGEPVPIRLVDPVDDDGNALDDTTAAASVTITGTGDDDTVYVDDAVIPWNGTAWVYDWVTDGAPDVVPGDYRAKIALTPTGASASWRYVDIHLEAPPVGSLLPYGSTVADVKALLPHRRWTIGSKPDLGDVERFLVSVGSILGVHVDLVPASTPAVVVSRLTALARRAVVYGAAAQAEAAANPERARPNDASSYAEWLLDRYREAVEEAEGYYQLVITEGDLGPVGDVDAEPAWSFPEPANFAARGI